MCGIFALIQYGDISTTERPINDVQLQLIFSLIDARGPDFKSSSINVDLEHLRLVFKASVLHLRGQELCPQPITDDQSNVLLFNGEIYEFSTIETNDIENTKSDTQQLMILLSETKDHEGILGVFSEIIGPFAVIYWHHSTKSLYFSRDIFGRRSLCIHDDPISKVILISSVAPLLELNWTEVQTNGIHRIRFDYSIDTPRLNSTNLWDLDKIYPKTKKCADDCSLLSLLESAFVKNPLKSKLEIDENPDTLYCLGHDVPSDTELKVLLEFGTMLNQSLGRRITKGKKLLCQDCKLVHSSSVSHCKHSSVAIAFSGGIDSAVLALLASDHVPQQQSIDLLNLAFGPDAPDRVTGSRAFLELIKIRPNRKWNFICIDINKEKLEYDRKDRIKYLIAPLKTVIDDSIGCALWYISRGLGRKFSFDNAENIDMSTITENLTKHIIYNSSPINLYRCPSRILIVGMGIDEQLGGYSLHKSAWSQNGFTGLFNEVSFQMRRLSNRNLGRDDRVGSDHGRDIKSPFLDETFVDYLNHLPVNHKMRLDLTPGVGDKIILRRYAKFVLGLEGASQNQKRAMQFGTRIAKLENKKESGHDICSRLS